MKKLLTVLFAALMSTSMLMAQEATKAPEKEGTKPVKTKKHVKKAPKKTTEEKKDDTKK
jgi:hypothetical protein